MVKKEGISEEAFRRAHEKAMSLKEAARVLGMTPQGVAYRWRVMGLKPHGKSRLPKSKRTVPAFFRLPKSIVHLIDSLSRKLGLTRSEIVSEAIKMMVEKYKYTRQQKIERED
jgi:hypothetical protein